jgi:predicted amidohydrolase YtcJ
MTTLSAALRPCRATLAPGFAIKDGRFIGVGSSDAMRHHVGTGTRIVDLGSTSSSPCRIT